MFEQYGIKIPKGKIAYTPAEAVEVAQEVSKKGPWVLKAQIQSGARHKGYFLEKQAGHGGGVRILTKKKEIFENAKQMLGATLVTVQTGPVGKKVSRIYVEAFNKVESGFYMALAVGRVAAELTLLVADIKDGDIMKIAMNKPKKVLRIKLDVDGDTRPEQVQQVMDFLKLPARAAHNLENLINGLHKAFLQKDAAMIEINPVGVMKNGELVALDAKISFDDNALFRQPEVAPLKDECELSERDIQASKYKFTYSEFDGAVGCIVNGDGLALTAMDLLKDKNKGMACFINVKCSP